MKEPDGLEPDPLIIDAEVIRDDAYSTERKELNKLLEACLAKNEPLRANERPVLSPDEVYVVLQKIKRSLTFSRKERDALTDAGFPIDKIYPDL